MDKGNNKFGPIVCIVHNSLFNVIQYTNELESIHSNILDWTDATLWTIDEFNKWVQKNKDAYLDFLGAPAPAVAFGASALVKRLTCVALVPTVNFGTSKWIS